MSRPAPHISPSAVLMGYKLPIPLKIVLGISVPALTIGALSAIFQTQQYDVAAILLFIGGGLVLFIYTNNSGYRNAWDDERVYMRDWGFRNLLFQRKPFHSIAYDDMVSMEGRFGTNAAAKSRFMPYEYLEIESRDPDDEAIWIYPVSLDARDLADFLVHLRGKRPGIFPEEVLELMCKDGLIESLGVKAR